MHTLWPSNQEPFLCKALLVYEDLSGSDSIQRKMIVRGLIYRLLIITTGLYDFDMCIDIFLTT